MHTVPANGAAYIDVAHASLNLVGDQILPWPILSERVQIDTYRARIEPCKSQEPHQTNQLGCLQVNDPTASGMSLATNTNPMTHRASIRSEKYQNKAKQ